MGAALKIVSNDDDQTITVPATVDELSATAEAFLSTGWTLAAAVWAWTYLGKPGPKRSDEKSSDLYTVNEFVRLGLKGLTTKDSVRKYRAIWQSAIDAAQATAVKPGETVVMPDLPFGLVSDEPETPGKGSDKPAKPRSEPSEDDEPEDDDEDVTPLPAASPSEQAKGRLGLTIQDVSKSIDRIAELGAESDDPAVKEMALGFLKGLLSEIDYAMERIDK